MLDFQIFNPPQFFHLNERKVAMPIKQGSIEFYFGPSDLGAPDNLETAIIDFIDAYHATLDIAVQELESYNIARAIVRAKQRGVRIRMVIEQDYLRSLL
jgi:hypothetical protein